MICYCIFPKFPEYNSNLTLTDDVIFVNQLKGAIVYYDGSHNDSRMCLSIAVTAARLGATVANHTRVTGLGRAKSSAVLFTERSNIHIALSVQILCCQ